jgi:LuxR family transcriptional regulator, maltose regulon positive regulatory protein
MNGQIIIQTQLLATKLFVPAVAHTLIPRPHLDTLLQKSLEYPLTLVSAPAGFGKTTLLTSWIRSLSADSSLVAWVSLDKEDNDPRLFWTYILAALGAQDPERFSQLFRYLQSPEAPPLKHVLTKLVNLLVDSTQHYVLILDDYHAISEQEVHTTLVYLIDYLPPRLHIILSTRADPPLPFPQLRARHQLFEVHADQLRCSAKEVEAFFGQVMGLRISEEAVQQVTARTEGWLVGLQLLGLSLHGRTDLATLLEETSGEQRYILDYLTQVVLACQPQEVQTFLLSTCILQQLNASICDAVLQQSGSQRMLERLEQANLFVVSLDTKRECYRYHALFAEVLHYQLQQTHADLVPLLHHRASLWYAQHDQTTDAILHAFKAREWQWVADLIEQQSLSLLSMTWGVGKHKLLLLRDWLKQLPTEVIHSRPRLCLACSWMLWTVAPQAVVEGWLHAAEMTLTASLPTLDLQARQDQEDLLGAVIVFRALVQSYQENAEVALALCQQALPLFSADKFGAYIEYARLRAFYVSTANNALAAVQSGLEGSSLAEAAGQTSVAITGMGATAINMIGAGRLHEAYQLTQQAIHLGTQLEGFVLPEVGWPVLLQADILREWNQLDAALKATEEAASHYQQAESALSLLYVLCGYAILLRVYLSRGELNAARSAFEQFEHIGMGINQSWYSYHRSLFTIIDQVRLWLACGELDRATQWVKWLDLGERHGTPFAREREEVARVRVLLAQNLPAPALERLQPVLQRATEGQRWGHVIEIWLLQALAHQMLEQQEQALSALVEAVRLAEPEGYIRSFVDEGSPMAALLSQLWEEQHKTAPTPYLDTLLAAFPRQNQPHKRQPRRTNGSTKKSKSSESKPSKRDV